MAVVPVDPLLWLLDRLEGAQWPAPVRPAQRGLCEAQPGIGRACGGAGGARSSSRASPHAVQAARPCCGSSPACPMPDTPAPSGSASRRRLGDQKGSRYGTIVVDPRPSPRRRSPPRSHGTHGCRLARTASRRRTRRPGSLDGVCPRCKPRHSQRSRSPTMAPAHHMRQAVERRLQGPMPGCGTLPLLPGSTARPARRDRAFARSTTELEAGAQSRMRWQAVYDEVRRRHAGGEPLLGIARAMGLARATVRKYASAETFPARLPHGAGPSLLDPHVAYLAGRIDEGCENAIALWREIREQGYPGTSRKCIASSPSAGRGRSDRAARPVVPRLPLRSRLDRKPRCRQHGSFRGCSCSRPRCWMRAKRLW